MTNREKNQARLLELLRQSYCDRCGLRDIRALTFDHNNPKTKKATVSRLVHQGHSWDVVMKEIRKCTILCLSCHQIVECERLGGRRQEYYEQIMEEDGS